MVDGMSAARASRHMERARHQLLAEQAKVPVLIKGLGYDHAVVLRPERLEATELYVSLTRCRDTLTVVSETRYLLPAEPRL